MTFWFEPGRVRPRGAGFPPLERVGGGAPRARDSHAAKGARRVRRARRRRAWEAALPAPPAAASTLLRLHRGGGPRRAPVAARQVERHRDGGIAGGSARFGAPERR